MRDLKTDRARVIDAGGLFYAIGHTPNTAFLEGQLTLDDTGYIVTRPGTTQTSIAALSGAAGAVHSRHLH